MPLSRRLLVVLVALVPLVGAACRADVTVAVDVDDDGAGTVDASVELDEEALDRVGGLDAVRTEDLASAGWSVEEPVALDDGGAVFAASRPFSDPAELASVLEEVSGPDGPYAQLGLRVDRPFARSQFRLEGVLDGSVGVVAFADPGLAGALDGLPFGTDLAELESELGAPPASFVGLELRVRLPGDVDTPTDAGSETAVTVGEEGAASARAWETTLDASSPVPVLMTSEVIRYRPLAFAGAAALLVVLLLLLVALGSVVGLRRRRRRRREREDADDRRARAGATAAAQRDEAAADDSAAHGAASGADIGATPAVGAGGAPPEADEASAPHLEMVVLGGPGATFGVRDEVDELVAFARSHGSTLDYPAIAERYGEASRGRLSTSELWETLGVEGDPAALDEEMLGRHQLTPGLREFVARARENGFRVAYLGDGPAGWSHQLRRSFRLEDLIDPWVVSSDVGATLPELAMFEALRRLSAVDPASCLLIDDRLRVLEAARHLGYGTAWFTPTGRATEAPGHSVIRSFADLLAG